ncbi:MAG: PLP-dependent aminotransferase family protein [Candidatus Izemoplasmatales bacterium]|jgi:GntR family transcriptional regulator/MocR family aminotransferase|nr:PLP-dependent aminotransferase family protein [Candidatus Izemoplasmatales bacterium]
MFLDRQSKTPLYEQLYLRIRRMIEEGKLISNTKMPSKRKLATNLSLSAITVDNAYQQLVAEGYLRSIPKSGFYVEKLLISAKKNDANIYLGPDDKEEQSSPKSLYDFKTNIIDWHLFPYDTWIKLSKEILSQPSFPLVNESDLQGCLGLRKAIAKYLASYRGIQAEPDQIVIGAGSEYLLGLVIQMIDKNQIVGLENPGYGKIARTFKSHEVKTIPISLDEQGLRCDELEKSQASVIHITPSHQFPLGIVMPVGRRLELLKWAEKGKNRLILEDDYDSEFRFSGLPIPALQGLDRLGKVIYFNSFSKSLAPSLRIGYMVLPRNMIVHFRESFSSYACSVPSFEQAILARFLDDGFFERHLNRMRKVYKNRRDYLIKALTNSTLNEYLEINNSDAGLHFIMRISNGMTETELIRTALKSGVIVYGVSDYYQSISASIPKAMLVMGYSGLSNTSIDTAIKILETAWDNAK